MKTKGQDNKSDPLISFGLFRYILIFIILTLHSPYMFLLIRDRLVLRPDGFVDYDMGGLFPYSAAAVMALLHLIGISALIFIVVTVVKYFIRSMNGILASLILIISAQGAVYYKIYLSPDTNPAILKNLGNFQTSLWLLAIFSFLSLLKILWPKKKPQSENSDCEKTESG